MHKPVIGEDSTQYIRRQKWLRYRFYILAGTVAVAVAIAGGLMWRYLAAKSSQTKTVAAAISASQAAYSKSDFTNALNLVNGAAQKATSHAQKAQVYQMQAQAASGLGKLHDAVHYYELKHQADPGASAPDAYALGTLYERLGQKDKALVQYRIALSYAQKQKRQYHSDADAIQAAIDNLEQAK